MRFQMIDGNERRAVDQSDGFCRGEADNDATDQAGTRGGGNARQRVESRAGVFHGGADDAIEHVDMGARGDFRNHAPKWRMFLDLGAHHIGQDPAAAVAAAFHHRGCGLIAGGFDPQHQCGLAVCQFQSLPSRSNRRFPWPSRQGSNPAQPGVIQRDHKPFMILKWSLGFIT